MPLPSTPSCCPQTTSLTHLPPGLPPSSSSSSSSTWESTAQIHEYTEAANPLMPPIPVLSLPALQHTSGPTRITPLDCSQLMHLDAGSPASSPNLLASFLRICVGESLRTHACATSQAFYVIHGEGTTQTEFGTVDWSTGDLFVIPGCKDETLCTHTCRKDNEENTGGAGLYWVHDSPLLSYLGVVPRVKKFEATFFSREKLIENVERVRHEPGAQHRNRLGILLGNAATPQTKTLSHVLWSLLNVLPAGDVQRPHRHNSVALDLALHAPPGTYTLMGKELDSEGHIVNPIRVNWETGAVFVTPPGWWHSHHNESAEEAWVLPMQDAGLYTHQRTLDIRFSHLETELLKELRIR